MSIISKTEDSAVFSKFQELVSKWLREIDATRVDVEYNVIALTGEVMTWVVVDGERKSVHLPSSLSYPMYDVRPSQVDSHRGAWLYSHFWMEAAEGVLHQEADWMREPESMMNLSGMVMLRLSWISFLGMRSGFRSGWQPRLPRITRRLRGGNVVVSVTVSGGLRRRLRRHRLRGRLV